MARPARGIQFGDMLWFPIPDFRSKARPQLPNGHHLTVDVDPKPRIQLMAALYLAHENYMTGMSQSIDPHGDSWAGGPQSVFVCVCHRKSKESRANNSVNPKKGAPDVRIPPHDICDQPQRVTIPSDIRVGRAVEVHELYKSVMIVGFPLPKRNIAQPGPAKLNLSGSRFRGCSEGPHLCPFRIFCHRCLFRADQEIQ